MKERSAEPSKFKLERVAVGGYIGPNLADYFDFDREAQRFVNAIHQSKLLPILLKDADTMELLSKVVVTRKDMKNQAQVPPARVFGGPII
jgi:hypothetical protein